MSEKPNHLDRTEACYEVEYDPRKDLHHKEGEILKLEYINAKHCREIERLNARISTILETTPDIQENEEVVQGDKIDRITELKNLFAYLKALLIELSSEEGNAPIDPDVIDVKYVEAASRYCFPVLFDKYAILDQEDNHKIEPANSILDKLGIETMAKY